MPLSEYEQRMLDELEKSLRGDDTEDTDKSPAPDQFRQPGVRRISVAIIGTIVGLTLVVFGAVQAQVIVGIIGFLLMLAAMIYGFGRPNGSSSPIENGAGSPKGSGAEQVKPGKSGQSMSEKMADRWERRRRGEL